MIILKTLAELKEFAEEQKKILSKSIERELAVKKEIEDDKAVLTYIQGLSEKNQPLPVGCSYESFGQWIESIKKEIKTGENSLKNIELDKTYIAVFDYIITKAKDEPVA